MQYVIQTFNKEYERDMLIKYLTQKSNYRTLMIKEH